MVGLNLKKIPEFYKSSTYFQNFYEESEENDDLEIEVPENCYIDSLKVRSPEDFCNLVFTINFWELKHQKAFNKLIKYVKNNSQVVDFYEGKSFYDFITSLCQKHEIKLFYDILLYLKFDLSAAKILRLDFSVYFKSAVVKKSKQNSCLFFEILCSNNISLIYLFKKKHALNIIYEFLDKNCTTDFAATKNSLLLFLILKSKNEVLMEILENCPIKYFLEDVSFNDVYKFYKSDIYFKTYLNKKIRKFLIPEEIHFHNYGKNIYKYDDHHLDFVNITKIKNDFGIFSYKIKNIKDILYPGKNYPKKETEELLSLEKVHEKEFSLISDLNNYKLPNGGVNVPIKDTMCLLYKVEICEEFISFIKITKEVEIEFH